MKLEYNQSNCCTAGISRVAEFSAKINWDAPPEVYEINAALTPPYPSRGSTLP
jgi:hypothetical protein